MSPRMFLGRYFGPRYTLNRKVDLRASVRRYLLLCSLLSRSHLVMLLANAEGPGASARAASIGAQPDKACDQS